MAWLPTVAKYAWGISDPQSCANIAKWSWRWVVFCLEGMVFHPTSSPRMLHPSLDAGTSAAIQRNEPRPQNLIEALLLDDHDN